jgi:hypothetical protein
VTNVVCLLERYGGLGNDGAKLGGFNVWWPLDGGLFFCVNGVFATMEAWRE